MVKEGDLDKNQDNSSKMVDSFLLKLQKSGTEFLEKDNFHDDPHRELKPHEKVPRFQESFKKRKYRKLKSTCKRKTGGFLHLLKEIYFKTELPNYVSACAPQSKFPSRHFCSVCGFRSSYTCVQCRSLFCCIRCMIIHKETRCLGFKSLNSRWEFKLFN